MAGLPFLVSFFTAGLLAKRVKHVDFQSQSVQDQSQLVPTGPASFTGTMRSLWAPPLAVAMGAGAREDAATRFDVRTEREGIRPITWAESIRWKIPVPMPGEEDPDVRYPDMPLFNRKSEEPQEADQPSEEQAPSAPQGELETDPDNKAPPLNSAVQERSLQGELETDPDSKEPPKLENDEGTSAVISSRPASEAANTFKAVQTRDQVTATLDPVARAEEQNKMEKKSEFKLNLGKAFDSLRRDIPEIMRFEDDPVRVTTTDWSIYTDDIETDLTNAVNPAALRVFGIVAPAWSASVKGLSKNQQALQELRIFRSKFVTRDVVTTKTGMGLDPITGDEVITSHWKVELTMRRFKVPHLLQAFAGGEWTPESIVTITAVSRFHFDAKGKIYRHSIDQLDMLSDHNPMTVTQLDALLGMVRGSPVALAGF